MRLLLIRHGESEADLLGVHEGRADFELTSRGHQQAEAMSEYVANHYQLTRIYCSTLKRAVQTATHLSQKLGLPLIPEEKLMEHNNGLLAGLTMEEADTKYPKIDGLPIHASVYEQESPLEFRFRVEYILSKIISEGNGDDTIAIVSHGGTINQMYRAFLRLPIDSDLVFPTEDTGIHEWLIRPNMRCILHSNLSSHTEGI